MTERESIEKSHALAAEWFAHHIATVTKFNAAEGDGLQIRWRRPDTGNYAMTYTIFGCYVVVTGDVGDAIYAFGQPITLEKLAQFDWHYFINKCCASETGRNYTMKYPGIKSPVPNCRAIGHFIGLQMAIKQLKATP